MRFGFIAIYTFYSKENYSIWFSRSLSSQSWPRSKSKKTLTTHIVRVVDMAKINYLYFYLIAYLLQGSLRHSIIRTISQLSCAMEDTCANTHICWTPFPVLALDEIFPEFQHWAIFSPFVHHALGQCHNGIQHILYWVTAVIHLSVQMFKYHLPNFLFGTNLTVIWKGLS